MVITELDPSAAAAMENICHTMSGYLQFMTLIPLAVKDPQVFIRSLLC